MTSKPTEMELRVAEAIKSVDDSKPKGGLGASYLSLARAAIRAMREPTEKMIEAGFDEDGGRYITWIKMIYAASPQEE
jgi:hypothetical protein